MNAPAPMSASSRVHFKDTRMRRLSVIVAAIVSIAAARPVMSQDPSAHEAVVPAGSTLTIRLLSTISTKSQHAGSRFEAELQEDFRSGSRVIAPAGAKVYGVVTRSAGGKKVGKQELATTITAIRIGDRQVPIVTDTAGIRAKEGGGLVKVGSGTLVGLAIGGPTSAIMGGAGGVVRTVFAKERHISIPAGTVEQVHLRAPLHLP
jgi:hypothetical protein